MPRKSKLRTPLLEVLQERFTPAVTAVFAIDTLIVTGDDKANDITIGRNSAGEFLINGGSVVIRGGKPTVVHTKQITVFGMGGDDTIKLDEQLGAMPRATLYGGLGNDKLFGGSSSDYLFGQAGDDQLFGLGGADYLFGGNHNDLLKGGGGDDQVYGEAGDDQLTWNPGDDTDFLEGGLGVDTVEVNGDDTSETFAVTANGQRVRLDRLDTAPFMLDIGTSEKLVLKANGGDDIFGAVGNLAALIALTIDGGSGNDTIRGGNGHDILRGGEGDDFVDGQQGNDIIFLGAGNDSFQWDPGDGNDVVEGEDGQDRLIFNGSAISEIVDVSSNSSRVRLTRNVANISLDVDGIERFDLQLLGGADLATINNLQATSLRTVNIDLAATIGGTNGDTQVDSVLVVGTELADSINVYRAANTLSVVGLTAQVNIVGADGNTDLLTIQSFAGNDSLAAGLVAAGLMRITLDGGVDNDTLVGSQGPDILIGGDGNDDVTGLQGDDNIALGTGNDLTQWDAGHGNDTVDGQDGADKLFLIGSSDDENFDISNNSARVRLARNVDAVLLDLDNIETLEMRVSTGADNVQVGDLGGTDLTRLDIDMRGSQGGSDNAIDTVTVLGSQGDDQILIGGDAGGLSVTGLAAEVRIFQHEPTFDRLTINASGGADTVKTISVRANSVGLSINGGIGNDTLIGGESNETFLGGDGNDLVAMGAGEDTFAWNPGDDNDSIEGGDGFDRLLLNGANVSENLAISANSGRVLLTRDIANVVLDLNQIEGLDIRTLGGTDVVTVGDLTGTNVAEVNLDLSSNAGNGDGQADRVVLVGTSNDDAIVVAGDSSVVSAVGLIAQVNVKGFDAGTDRLLISTLGGDDVVNAATLQANSLALSADGGADDDVLIGGDGIDVLLGGDGDDILIGGPGIDLLDGGSGDNILIQD